MRLSVSIRDVEFTRAILFTVHALIRNVNLHKELEFKKKMAFLFIIHIAVGEIIRLTIKNPFSVAGMMMLDLEICICK